MALRGPRATPLEAGRWRIGLETADWRLPAVEVAGAVRGVRLESAGPASARAEREPPMNLSGRPAQRVMSIVWPAFLVAAAAELVFFSIFDPFELHFFGAPLDLSREAIYAMGFFGFWGLGDRVVER